MTDDEKFEYKSEEKPIKGFLELLDVSMINGLECTWRGKIIDKGNDHFDSLRLFWGFNWDELKTKGIDRLSGYIMAKPADGYFYHDGLMETKIDIDLTKSNQIIEKVIVTHAPRSRFLPVSFSYSLIPHYTQIKENQEIKKEITSETVPVVIDENKEEQIKEQKKKLSSFIQSDGIFLSSEQNDAVLVVDGKKIPVNRVFLSYHSEYFKTLFSLNDKDGKVNEIPIEGISYEDFKLLLSTISPKMVFPNDQTVEKLLELATRFKMPSVIHHCERHLLHVSKLENEKKTSIGEKYEMTKVLEMSILEPMTDESVEKMLELATRLKISSMIHQCEFHLLYSSKIEIEKKLWMSEKYKLSGLLEKSILGIDTIEKLKKWKRTPEYWKLSDMTKLRVYERLF